MRLSIIKRVAQMLIMRIMTRMTLLSTLAKVEMKDGRKILNAKLMRSYPSLLPLARVGNQRT